MTVTETLTVGGSNGYQLPPLGNIGSVLTVDSSNTVAWLAITGHGFGVTGPTGAIGTGPTGPTGDIGTDATG